MARCFLYAVRAVEPSAFLGLGFPQTYWRCPKPLVYVIDGQGTDGQGIGRTVFSWRWDLSDCCPHPGHPFNHKGEKMVGLRTTATTKWAMRPAAALRKPS